VQTDREVRANKPAIIKSKKDKTCLLLTVTTISGKNVMQNEAEKKLEHKSLGI
jgi:hypothetical protein